MGQRIRNWEWGLRKSENDFRGLVNFSAYQPSSFPACQPFRDLDLFRILYFDHAQRRRLRRVLGFF
jgi:hypothetical protein